MQEYTSGRQYDPEKYGKDYFVGAVHSNYEDYTGAEWVVREQAKIAHMTMKNRSGIGKLLEVAAAYGHGLVEWSYLGWDAEGFEFSEFAVKRGHELHSNLRLTVGDAMKSETWSSYTDKEFDLLANFEMLEHLPWDDCPTVLEHMARVAKWGVFTLDCATYPDEDVQPMLDADKTHLHCFPKAQWITLFHNYGQLDFHAMHEFYQRTYLFNSSHGLNLTWGPRAFVIKFD